MTVKILKYIFGFIIITSLSSCISSDDDSNLGNNNQTQLLIESYLQSGTWKVTYFKDSGVDETNHFSEFSFTFGSNGGLTASNGIETYTGTWSVTDSNSNDDSEDDLHLNIYFNLTNDFEDLNEDWNFISYSSSIIELIDISGGNGGTDYLTFEKI